MATTPARPRVICHMTASLDGRLHPSRYTDSPDGSVKEWSALYERLHDRLGGGAWMVGRVTMAEMAKGSSHPPARFDAPPRPHHLPRAAEGAMYAVAPDRSAALHFRGADIGGDQIVVLLAGDVADAHLAGLAADGVGYLVADGPEIDLAAALATLRRELGVETLLLEGGGGLNGSMMAAGLVDELSVLFCPALDGKPDRDAIVSWDDGLKGRARLSLRSCETLEHGAVWLRYGVVHEEPSSRT